MSLTQKLNGALNPDELSIFGYICHEGKASLNHWAYCTDSVERTLASLEQRELIKKDKFNFYSAVLHNSGVALATPLHSV